MPFTAEQKYRSEPARGVCRWLGSLVLGVLLPWLAVAAGDEAGGVTGANDDPPVLKGWKVSPRANGILSNWPSANVETGFLNRAVMPAKPKPDYKWANITVESVQGKTNEMEVPREFALAAPRPPRGMTMIPGGMFLMGFGPVPLNSEGEARKITSFYIDAYDVPGNFWTEVWQWAIAHGYSNLAKGQNGVRPGGKEAGPNHPVVNVSWYDCVKWCNARSEKEMLVPAYYLNETQKEVYRTGNADLSNICVDWTANGYRLPTEAEWEKAARGGVDGKLYPWGDTLNENCANYSGDNGAHTNGTTPIGFYRLMVLELEGKKVVLSDENAYGMHDMAGNVYQWCWDWFAPYTANTCGPMTGAYRVIRGGCWASVEDSNLACGYRNAMRPGTASPYVGFRCVRKR